MKRKLTMMILAGCLTVTAMIGCGSAEKIANVGTEHNHTWNVVYETVHHDAIGHYETIGHYDNVVTGYNGSEPIYMMQWVDDGTSWIEDVAAYDEQVVDHYECSCGATRQ